MSWVPVRLSGKLTLGGVFMLLLTCLIVYLAISLSGQPRVIEASNSLIKQTGENIVGQLNQQLIRIEGEGVSLARLAEVLPHDEALVKQVLPQIIDSKGDKSIAGGGIWPEPNAFSEGWHAAASSGHGMPAVGWITLTGTTTRLARVTITKAGIPPAVKRLPTGVTGLKFTRTRFPT